MNDRKYLFVGGMFFDSTIKEIFQNSKSAMQNAANKLQWGYVKGIESNLNTNIDILNAVFIGTFPKYYKKMIIPSRIIKRNDCDRYVKNVGFVNLPMVSSDSKFFNMKKELSKWIEENSENEKVVIAYGFFSVNFKVLEYVKKIDPSIKTALIILDLPEFMYQGGKTNIYRRYSSKSTNNAFERCKKYIDSYSVITEYIAERLNLVNNYTVIEGMVENDESLSKIEKEKSFVFLYTGGLSEAYGTTQLINSFKSLKSREVELWICGDGLLKEFVINEAVADNRIKYFGNVEQSRCFELQKKASCLINPRMDSEMTKYSFPSKTMEYFASGTPLIACCLKGIPKEYKNYMITFDCENELKRQMERAIDWSAEELEDFGKKAQSFIYKEKNCKVQTKKLLDLINREMSKE